MKLANATSTVTPSFPYSDQRPCLPCFRLCIQYSVSQCISTDIHMQSEPRRSTDSPVCEMRGFIGGFADLQLRTLLFTVPVPCRCPSCTVLAELSLHYYTNPPHCTVNPSSAPNRISRTISRATNAHATMCGCIE